MLRHWSLVFISCNRMWSLDVRTFLAMEEITALDKYEQQVDLMNECRSFYYSRLQKTEHYKKIFGIEPTKETTGIAKKEKPLVSSMQRLQREIVSIKYISIIYRYFNKQLRNERMIRPTSCVEVLCNNHK